MLNWIKTLFSHHEEEPPTCTSCAYFLRSITGDRCAKTVERNPVTGQRNYLPASTARIWSRYCGPKGTWYFPRVTVKS